MNTWKRRALALLSVPLLSIPSAYGVYLWLVPLIGLAESTLRGRLKASTNGHAVEV